MKSFLKKFLASALTFAVLFGLAYTADATRSIYRNRTLPPHFLESSVQFPGLQTFTTTGTWYRPPGVEYVLAIVCGGGGGGGGHQVATQLSAGGGQGGQCKTGIVDVRGTASATFTIGTGGGGGAAHADGDAGISSIFIGITAVGGAGGDTARQETYEAADIGAGIGGAATEDGSAGAYGVGGAGDAGGGGGGSYGAGGAGGAADTNGTAAAANTGGGGGGAGNDTGSVPIGGNGGKGIGIIIPLPKTFTLP